MSRSKGKPGLRVAEVLAAWKSILTGSTPILSIEITRECPLSCPGCYAYGSEHLGGAVTLRSLSDYRGDALVDGVIELVEQHRPLHVSLVGGEPLVRHRELSRILPKLSEMKINTMVVTSAVISIPKEWMQLPLMRVAVSVDGLPEHHDVRRKPATYERILKNIEGCRVNVHGTFTGPMVRPGYLEEYVKFWDARPEVARIWASLYSPQQDEQSPEMLSAADRDFVATELVRLQPLYPKLLMNRGIAEAIRKPPSDPQSCMFARMSTNYSADLRTRVEPCVLGGRPDCSQCGCVASSGLHWLQGLHLGPLKLRHLAYGSTAMGKLMGRLRKNYRPHPRWEERPLVQIDTGAGKEAA